MQITVIVCTYNRSRSLEKLLRSILAQTLAKETEWEVMVVDSSSDDTRQMVEEFCRQYPGRVRYVFEPQPGKSNALNTGIRESAAEILAFVDDDVTVEATWLAHLTSALSDGTWAGAGGRVVLQWDCPRPHWLPVTAPRIRISTAAYEVPLDAALPRFDQGDRAGELKSAPIGANMAFRKRVFELHGTFRADLGPSRSVSKRHSEDMEFGRRLMASGECLRYEPEAVVYHPVPQDRLKKTYFLSWWFAYGSGVALEFGIPHASHYWFGVPRYLVRAFAEKILAWILALRPSERFLNKVKVWEAAGEIAEFRRQARAGGTPPRQDGKTGRAAEATAAKV